MTSTLVTGSPRYWFESESSTAQLWVDGIVSLATVVPTVTITTRRLHDVNFSGWWQLMVVPALVAALVPSWVTDGIAPSPVVMGLVAVGGVGALVCSC